MYKSNKNAHYTSDKRGIEHSEQPYTKPDVGQYEKHTRGQNRGDVLDDDQCFGFYIVYLAVGQRTSLR